MGAEMTETGRAADLLRLAGLNAACEKCPRLVESRSNVVFGAGSPDAKVMFVGEAPGASEDVEGVPFVGASGKLLDGLLEGIGLSRSEVFITSVLKCRPPDNRDPKPDEIGNCSPWLQEQIAIISPTLLVSLGNYATRLLRGSPEGITKVRGRDEVIEIGTRRVRLYPVFHPAAALYRRPNLAVLEEDFARIPELARMEPPQQEPVPDLPDREDPGRREPAQEDSPGDTLDGDDADRDDQLGLF